MPFPMDTSLVDLTRHRRQSIRMENLSGPTSNAFISQRLRMNYVDWGNPDAPPLILQHGGRDHCRSWDWVAEALRHDWHVIAPDLRGHGDSQWSPEGNYAMDAFVYDFAQLVDTLGYDQVTIVGHSLGGNISTRFAGLYPEKVRKLVNIEGLGPVSTNPGPTMEDLHEWIEAKRKSASRTPKRYARPEDAYLRMKSENAFLSDSQARHLTTHGIQRNEDGTYSWKFDNYLNVWGAVDISFAEKTRLWASVTCPVLMLWGNRSFASNPAADGRLDHFKDVKLIEYPDAGHWLHHDQTARFLEDVSAFL